MTIEIPNGFAPPLVVATIDGRVALSIAAGHRADPGHALTIAYLDREQCAQLLAALHRAAECAWPGPNEAEVVPRHAEMGGPL